MKRKKSTVDSRRRQLLDLIIQSDDDNLDAEDLAAQLDISPVTLRRDLRVLQDEGLVLRSYGKVSAPGRGDSLADSPTKQCCDRIARKAAALVEDGDTIFINTSSTALRMVEYITAKNVTVITNNCRAIYCGHNPDLNIILTGGEVRFPKHAMVGDFTLRNLQQVYARKCFVGCSGISPEAGMTTMNANEATINLLMLTQVTGTAYILADHTKIGNNSSFTSAGTGEIHNLITDTLADENALAAFRALGINVYQA